MMNKTTLVLLLSLFLLAGKASPQTPQSMQRECKSAIKRFQSKGWRIYDSRRTLEQVVTAYYDTLGVWGDKAQVVVGQAEGRTAAVAVRKALSHVATQRALMQGSHISGVSTAALTDSSEVLASGSVTSSEQRVVPLHPALRIYRVKTDGSVEAQVFVIIHP